MKRLLLAGFVGFGIPLYVVLVVANAQPLSWLLERGAALLSGGMSGSK